MINLFIIWLIDWSIDEFIDLSIYLSIYRSIYHLLVWSFDRLIDWSIDWLIDWLYLSQLICSYLLWPIAFLMGIDIADCGRVAELLGVKIFLNMIVAYTRLAELMANREALEAHLAANGTFSSVGRDVILHEVNVTLANGVMQVRCAL